MAVLAFRGVTVRYGSTASPAVRDLDLVIEAGECVALIGPSGAGKSTMLGLANGLVLPSAGSVEVFGVPTHLLGRRAHRDTRRRIASVQQNFALVGPLRVAHNVAAGRLGTWSAAQAIRSLVRPTQVADISSALTRMGIADKIWERADQLSGGQQQRTAIARAIFQGGDLVLADEPLSALDPARSDAVMGELVSAVAEHPDRALVASLHDAPLALQHCDRVVAMRDGVIVFDLTSAEVTADMLDDIYALEHVTG